MPRDTLALYLDDYLRIGAWSDKSLNGLQVEGSSEIHRVAVATDAALATFDMAIEAGAEFMIVHHGLFWGSAAPIRGPMRARIAALLDAGISLYAAHLPLDGHPEVGNNAVLFDLLELGDRAPFGVYGGATIGWRGAWQSPLARSAVAARLEALLGARPDVLPFGRERIGSVALVSGDAPELIAEAAAAGVDAFVTGETSHIAWHMAREYRMNVFFGGHYATETVGVRALADHLTARFGVETVFLDAPTGY